MLPCRHVAVLAPVAVTLLNHLRATVDWIGSGQSVTPHEAAFRARFLPQLQAALDGLQRPSEADVGRPDAIWAPLKRLRDALALELRCCSLPVRQYGCMPTGLPASTNF